MTGPSSTPRGEHTPRPGATWVTTTVRWTGEQLADDDAPPPRPNRATRRAARTAEVTTTDLFAHRDKVITQLRNRVAKQEQRAKTAEARATELQAEVARLTQAVTDADQDAAEAREHNERTCETVTERDQLRTRVEELEAKAAHLTAGQCTHTRAMCQQHHAVPVADCPYPRCIKARQQAEAPSPRCVCGDPIQLRADIDPTSWIHSPGSDTPCLNARPATA